MANSEVKALLQSEEQKRGQVGKRATEQGVAATIRYYSKKFNLKESSVRTWRHPGDSHMYHRLKGELARLISRRRGQVDVVGVVVSVTSKIKPAKTL